MTSAHCAPVIHLLTPHKTCSRDSCARDILAGPHTLQICCGRSHAMFQPLLIGASNRKATEARPGLARPGTRHSETWMEKVLFDHQCWSIHPSCVWFILLKVLEYIYFIWYYNLFILNFFLLALDYYYIFLLDFFFSLQRGILSSGHEMALFFCFFSDHTNVATFAPHRKQKPFISLNSLVNSILSRVMFALKCLWFGSRLWHKVITKCKFSTTVCMFSRRDKRRHLFEGRGLFGQVHDTW